MLKKTVTYEDFNGDTVTEDHFFHLSKADLIELELSAKGGMEAYLTKIVESGDNREIFAEFKKLMLMAYGTRSEDGKRFIKNTTLRDEFVSSEAFSELLMSLLQDENAAADFINGIVPQGLNLETPEMIQVVGPQDITPITENVPFTPRTLTRTEMFEMDKDELKSGLATGRYLIGP